MAEKRGYMDMAREIISAADPEELAIRAYENAKKRGLSQDQMDQAYQSTYDASDRAMNRGVPGVAKWAAGKAQEYYKDPSQIPADALKVGASLVGGMAAAPMMYFGMTNDANAGEKEILERQMWERIRQKQAEEGRASGGRTLQDQYPTHYYPKVGRQVAVSMSQGGVPDVVDQAMQLVPQENDPTALARSVVDAGPSPLAKPVKAPLYTIAPDHRRTMDEHKGTGLQFPEEEGLKRLRAQATRKEKEKAGKGVAGYPSNERMVVRAPKDNRGLPDFVAGKINFDDWINRHEKLLSPDEIHKAGGWYKSIYDTFANYYDDPNELKRSMRAWLVAQQNVSPEGAQSNALLQKEQIKRGVPEEEMQLGGLESPTKAARAALRDERMTGVGQKIADFVDAAEGKSVRSWMANHPHGGAPFVVDVHTARDTGMVDDELINHLRRLGYNEDDLSKLNVDLKGSPTEANYENRAEFGRALTDYLNQKGWQGRNDWTPSEVQAIGWMGMTRLTQNKEPTAESGLGKNYRRISFEMAPGAGSPWEAKFGERFAALSPDQQRELTQNITQKALDSVAQMAGIDVHRIVHGSGGWMRTLNPATVAQGQMHKSGGDIAANALGYLLNQDEVWHNNIKPMTKNPKAFAVDFVETGTKNLKNDEELQNFWQKLQEADPTGLFEGFQPIVTPDGKVGIRALISKGGEKTKQKLEAAIQGAVMEGRATKGGGPIRQMLASLPYDVGVMGHEAEISKHGNNWKENPNGESYLARLVNLTGPDSGAHLNRIRQELEKEIEGHFARFSQGQKGPSQEVKRASGGLVEENPYDDSIGASGEYPQAHAEAGELQDAGGIRRSESFLSAPDQGISETPLEGLPTKIKVPATGEIITAEPDARIRGVARQYMEEAGLPYNPPQKYKRVNPEEAAHFAQAFEEMQHDPEHPLVQASYAQMIKEVGEQYQAAKRAGAKFEFWNPETEADPYAASPRLATEDLRKNHHMFVFPTHAGYGDRPITEQDIKENPLLADSGERWNGMPVTYNDLFRAIHDYYGHAKEGVGFRHDGEENAWRAHSSMFSPLARLAMTSETRGQNSWLNFGPHGEKNRNAKVEDTVFADQKIGALPLWVLHHEAEDIMHPEDLNALKQIYAQHGMDIDHRAPHKRVKE